MNKHQLPRRIAVVMLSTVALCLVTVAGSIFWMGRALDEGAHQHALTIAADARAAMLEETRLLLLDYAKWEAAVPFVRAQDLSWMYDNIGASAVSGVSFQLAVLWGGSYTGPIGWAEDDSRAPRGDLADPQMLSQIEAWLRRIPLNLYQGTQFFTWHDGSLFAIGAARVEADAADAVADLISYDRATPRILIGRKITWEALSRIGDGYLLTDLRVSREVGDPDHSLPLLGASGEPVAYLTWELRHPGTEMIWRMAPVLLFVMAVTAGLALGGMFLLRRHARFLLWAEQEASVRARTDPLTSLPNRFAFTEALAAPLSHTERAILFLDLNGFKHVNDSLGHEAGDKILVHVAKRLSSFVDSSIFLARIAGDEFVFVLEADSVGAQVKWLAHSIQRILDQPIILLGRALLIRAAMGYAVQSSLQQATSDLVRQADLAMYEAKRRKMREALGFESLLYHSADNSLQIETELRTALSACVGFSVQYQPIVDREGNFVRAEALARWTSPELGSVPPDQFIAVAERAGLIVELGRQVLQIVCSDLASHPELNISLNVSPIQIMAPDFLPTMRKALAVSDVEPRRIELELTESAIVDDRKLITVRLEEIRAAGFSLALDDFGVGYSSVGYLRQHKFDTLKIDRSLLADIRQSPQALAVMDGIVTMAAGLGLEVVCEGVETAEEAELVRELGCGLLQGYYFGRPMSLADLEAHWLEPNCPQASVA